jgi:DNA-binding transcriptional LysR family regulator
VDSESLRTFLVVQQRGSVSAAAVALSRTQSAISRRLAVLEQQLGAPLFERIGRGLVLSEVGAALLPYAAKVAAALGDARAAVDEAKSGATATVRLVTVGTLADAALTKRLRRFKARFPRVDLRVETATSAQVSARVRAGAASIGLRYFEDASADLACRIVRRERLVVACSPSHRLAGKRVIRLAQLAQERWLMFPVQEGGTESFAATVLAQFLARGIAQIDAIAIDSLTAQKRLVEANFGLALLQESAVDEERRRGELSIIRVSDLDVTVPIVCITRRNGYLSGGAAALAKALER